MNRWLKRKGITGKDIFYMLAGLVPLILFVGLGIYAVVVA